MVIREKPDNHIIYFNLHALSSDISYIYEQLFIYSYRPFFDREEIYEYGPQTEDKQAGLSFGG